MNGGIGVQRLDAVELEAQLGGLLAGLDVDIPEDLEVVADEADRRDQDLADALRVRVSSSTRMSGPSHGSPVGLSLWNANDQSEMPACSATSRDVSSSWSRYGSPSARIRSGRLWAVKTTCASVPPHALGQERDVRLVVVPALDEDQLGSAVEPLLEPVAVPADRDTRVVRRQHEPDEPVGTVSERALDGLRDPRVPMLHAHVNGQAGRLLQAGPLRLRDPVQRRGAADAAVALDQLVHGLLREPAGRRGCPRSRRGCPRGARGSRRP